MQRTPRIDQAIWKIFSSEETAKLLLNNAQDGLALDAQQATYLMENGRCAKCQSHLSLESKKLVCKLCGVAWSILLPSSCNAEIDTIVNKQTARAKRFARQAVIKKTEYRHTPSQIKQLAQAQGYRCFYCATPFPVRNQRSVFHKDHCEPLALGGSDAISNIVLSCPACNLDKGTQGSDTYIRQARKKLTIERRELLSKIHKNARDFKKSLVRSQ